MGEIMLPGDKGFDNGVVQTWKGTKVIEQKDDYMTYDSDNDNTSTSNGSTTSKNGFGDDRNDESGESIEKSEEEESVVFNRNTTDQEQQRVSPLTKKASRAKVSKGNGKHVKRPVRKTKQK